MGETVPDLAALKECLGIYDERVDDHVRRMRGLVKSLPIDPEKYKAQRAVYLPGQPQPELLPLFAGAVEKDYPALCAQLEEGHNARYLDQSAELLVQEGQSLWLAGNHPKVSDLPVAQGALSDALRQRGAKFENALIIGKLITRLAFAPAQLEVDMEAVDALKAVLCDHLFFSFPRSESLNRATLSPEAAQYIDSHNKAMREAVIKVLSQKSLVIGLDPAGTTAAPIDGSCILGRVGTGTERLLQTHRTSVLPTAIWFEGDEPFIEICGPPRPISAYWTAHDIMQTIAARLSARINTCQFSYTETAGANDLA